MTFTGHLTWTRNEANGMKCNSCRNRFGIRPTPHSPNRHRALQSPGRAVTSFAWREVSRDSYAAHDDGLPFPPEKSMQRGFALIRNG
jgi:hypothetical protein